MMKKIKFISLIALFCFFQINAQMIKVTDPHGDIDGDGIQNMADADNDNDGIEDCVENGVTGNMNDLFNINGHASQVYNDPTGQVSSLPYQVQLTRDLNSQSGQLWSRGKINFSSSFTLTYQAYLGVRDSSGADGIAAVFHNDPAGINAIGLSGEGIGAKGIQNGIVLELDTWHNTSSPYDIANDHGSIWLSKHGPHVPAGVLSTAVDLGNIEDGKWHNVVTTWNYDTRTLSYTIQLGDGSIVTAGTYTFSSINQLKDIFGGTLEVYYGYTGSTGGSINDQRVKFVDLCSDFPAIRDTDGDGTPDYLDLDSDGDGCPDAIEGDENVTAAMLTNASGTVTVGTGSTAANQNLGTTVDAQGVPTVVNAGGAADVGSDQGQGIGDSQNIMVNSCAVPFICDTNMYLVQGDPATLYRIDTSTNPFNFVQIGTGATYLVNATGYNPTDNFIYGISGGANVAKSLIRIDANGTFYNLGVISGLDITAGYTSGEIDNNGNYYIKLAGTGNNKLYKVDIATRTATLIPLSRNINFIDIAYTQTDGLLWTQDTVSKKLVSINPTNGLVTDLPFVNTLNNYGAWFGSGTGQIYASSNDGTAFVEFDKTTGEAMFISTTQPSANNDGAHCPTAPITFDLYCRKLPVTNAGTQLPSNLGITALGRAGADNSNWPMVRQSAWTVLEAKTKGFVVNRVANPATDIANPVEGMMVFDTTAQCLKIYNGTVWSCYSTPACP